MFGIKIIKESEYIDLVTAKDRHYEAYKQRREVFEKMKEDCDGLRTENAKLRKEIDKLRSTTADIYFEVISKPMKCDLCKNEVPSCKKITVGKKNVCIIPKTK